MFINKNKLFLAVLESYDDFTDISQKKPIPYGLFYRKLIENLSSINEVVTTVKSHNIGTTNSLFVSDSSRFAVLEIDGHKVEIRKSEANAATGQEYIYALNFFKNRPAFQAREERRIEVVQDLMTEEIDYSSLKDFLEETAIGTIFYSINLQSMIIFPNDFSVEISFGPPPAANKPFETISLKSFLMSY